MIPMGKRLLNLYVEDEQIEQCKARGINMSALFRSMINAEMVGNDANAMTKLKLKLAKATKEIIELKTKLERQAKDLKSKQMEKDGWHKPN